MRGAVSVALVYLYYDPDGDTVDAQQSSLISMTLTVVLFSTLAYGAVTKPLLDLLLGARPGTAWLLLLLTLLLLADMNTRFQASSPCYCMAPFPRL